MTPPQRRLWEVIKIDPIKWQENDYKMNNLYELSYQDGVLAGEELMALISKIEPALKDRCDSRLTKEDLGEFLDQFATRSKRQKRIPCIEGLFSVIIKPTELASRLITIWGVDEFWNNQSDYAPICDVSPDLGFVQFGSWTGASDGDGWIVDTEFEKIACLSLNLLDYDADTVREYCYSTFTSLWQLVSFLACDSWERGWIEKPRFLAD